MRDPTNLHYVVAVNNDKNPLYPFKKTSHMKDDTLHPEVQDGYLTTAYVTPDGQITPDEIDPDPGSILLQGLLWNDLYAMHWQQIKDDYLW